MHKDSQVGEWLGLFCVALRDKRQGLRLQSQMLFLLVPCTTLQLSHFEYLRAPVMNHISLTSEPLSMCSLCLEHSSPMSLFIPDLHLTVSFLSFRSHLRHSKLQETLLNTQVCVWCLLYSCGTPHFLIITYYILS